jgi:hypothetical protein
MMKKKMIRFLKSGGYNDRGETATIVNEDSDNVYYYDGADRYVYLSKSELGKSFEYVDEIENGKR